MLNASPDELDRIYPEGRTPMQIFVTDNESVYLAIQELSADRESKKKASSAPDVVNLVGGTTQIDIVKSLAEETGLKWALAEDRLVIKVPGRDWQLTIRFAMEMA